MKQERTIRNSWYEAEAQGLTQEDYWQTPLIHMHKKIFHKTLANQIHHCIYYVS